MVMGNFVGLDWFLFGSMVIWGGGGANSRIYGKYLQVPFFGCLPLG